MSNLVKKNFFIVPSNACELQYLFYFQIALKCCVSKMFLSLILFVFACQACERAISYFSRTSIGISNPWHTSFLRCLYYSNINFKSEYTTIFFSLAQGKLFLVFCFVRDNFPGKSGKIRKTSRKNGTNNTFCGFPWHGWLFGPFDRIFL